MCQKDDLISRQAVLNLLHALPLEEVTTKAMLIQSVKQMDAAQPERKTGKWEIYVISMFDGEGCRCSECGLEGVSYWDFCPNCGADMREVDDERPD